MWFRKDNGVSISSPWSTSHNWNDHPLSLLFTVSHVKKIQIIGCETSTTSGSTVDNHLHLLNICGRMCSSWRWRNTLWCKFGPSIQKHVENISFAGHRIFSGISSSSTELDNFMFTDGSGSMPKSCLWNAFVISSDS